MVEQKKRLLVDDLRTLQRGAEARDLKRAQKEADALIEKMFEKCRQSAIDAATEGHLTVRVKFEPPTTHKSRVSTSEILEALVKRLGDEGLEASAMPREYEDYSNISKSVITMWWREES